jgi:uncharacterized protein (DUF433 family)
MANNDSPKASAAVQHAQSWIQKTPDVCGGAACIRRTRFTVWGLVEWRTMGLTDARIIKHHPDLSQADLDAAWAYYQQHAGEIDEATRRNEEA